MSQCSLCEASISSPARFCDGCLGTLATSQTLFKVGDVAAMRTIAGPVALFGTSHRLPRAPTPAPPSEPAPSALFGAAYQVIRPLGQGGMGQVFECLDVALGRRVAIKCLHREILADPALRSRFVQEARTLAAVRHPCVLPVFHFGEHEARPFFVTELVIGTDLAAAIEGETLGLGAVVRILDEAASGLEALHRAGVVHCDVKPSNLLIRSSDGQTLVADAGLARGAGAAPARELMGYSGGGSVGYSPPEQLDGSEPPHAAWDVFSLAATAYHALSGRPPFPWATAAAIASPSRRTVPPISSLRPELTSFDALLARALSTDRRKRLRSMSELRQGLRAALRVSPRRPEVATPDYVLVADDDPDVRRLLGLCIEQIAPHLEIRFAADGGIALRLIEEQPPTLAFLDVDMPACNGLEVLAAMRGGKATVSTPAIIVSARAGESEQSILLRLGAFGFLNKPLDPKVVMRLFSAALEKGVE